MDILTILSLLIHKYRFFSYIYIYLNSFHQCFVVFSEQLFLPPWLFIPKYFIVSDVIIWNKWDCFYNVFSDCSLLFYRNTTHFACWYCILQFCLMCVCPNRLFMFWNLNISLYMIILSVNRDHFAFWFPIWELYFFFID